MKHLFDKRREEEQKGGTAADEAPLVLVQSLGYQGLDI